MLGELSWPARRHKCEICFKVFDCHLCTIDCTHAVHENHTESRLVYVCLDCAEKNRWIGVITTGHQTIHHHVTLYNYKTGKLVDKQKLYGRAINCKHWVTQLKLSTIKGV